MITNKSTTAPTDTLIIGGGIVGASLALSLANANCPVTLVDARPRPTEAFWQDRLANRDSRVYALSLASIQLLQKIGAWQHIHQRKADFTQMQVWQKDGMGMLNFAEPNSSRLLGSMVEPAVIEHALYKQLTQAETDRKITLINGQKMTQMIQQNQGYQIQLENGESLQAGLIVGADGRNSQVRQNANIQIDTLDYDQIAICGAIRLEYPHNHTARQIMLPTGTLAFLPLADLTPSDHSTPHHWQSFVWTLPTHMAKEKLKQPPQQLAKDLALASQYELGSILQIENITSYPLSAQQARTYIKDHLALIGDAAHGVHPLAGQGLNLGLLDVQALAHALIEDKQFKENHLWASKPALKKYQRQRRLDNQIMMHSFSIINWAFAGKIPNQTWLKYLRGQMFYQVSKNRFLLNFFSKKASGLS